MAHWKSKQGEREAMDGLVRQNPGIRPAELARRLGLSRSTVMRRLPAMEDAGYLYSEDERGGLHFFRRRK